MQLFDIVNRLTQNILCLGVFLKVVIQRVSVPPASVLRRRAVHARVSATLLDLPLKQLHWSVGWLITLLMGASAVANQRWKNNVHENPLWWYSQVDGCEQRKKAASTWEGLESLTLDLDHRGRACPIHGLHWRDWMTLLIYQCSRNPIPTFRNFYLE